MSINIGSIGYNHSHGSDFFQNHPQGIGCYLLLLIKTPAFCKLNKKKFEIKANSFLLISPTTPCSYGPTKDIYTDDWLFFGIDEDEKSTFEKLKIPFDKPIFLGNIDELSQLIHFIAFEHYSSDFHHTEIEKHYIQIFLYKISRMIQSENIHSTELFATKNDKITYLRTKIYAEPGYFLTVDDMADFVNLSRSRFQHLYKENFGINVKSDLIQARIEYCKKLLETTPFTISEIASKTGYKSEYSLMRQFKETTGQTPSEFRKGKINKNSLTL